MRIEMTGKTKPIYFQSFSPTQKVIQDLSYGHYQPWVELFTSEWKSTFECKSYMVGAGKSEKVLANLNQGMTNHLDVLTEGFLAKTVSWVTFKERIESLAALLNQTQLVYHNVNHHWHDDINLKIMRGFTLIATAKEAQGKRL